jgi:hypothetical protein
LVRSKKAAKQLRKAGALPEQVFTGSTTDVAAVARAMEGCDAVVLCTSAVPQVNTPPTPPTPPPPPRAGLYQLILSFFNFCLLSDQEMGHG